MRLKPTSSGDTSAPARDGRSQKIARMLEEGTLLQAAVAREVGAGEAEQIRRLLRELKVITLDDGEVQAINQKLEGHAAALQRIRLANPELGTGDPSGRPAPPLFVVDPAATQKAWQVRVSEARGDKGGFVRHFTMAVFDANGERVKRELDLGFLTADQMETLLDHLQFLHGLSDDELASTFAPLAEASQVLESVQTRKGSFRELAVEFARQLLAAGANRSWVGIAATFGIGFGSTWQTVLAEAAFILIGSYGLAIDVAQAWRVFIRPHTASKKEATLAVTRAVLDGAMVVSPLAALASLTLAVSKFVIENKNKFGHMLGLDVGQRERLDAETKRTTDLLLEAARGSR